MNQPSKRISPVPNNFANLQIEIIKKMKSLQDDMDEGVLSIYFSDKDGFQTVIEDDDDYFNLMDEPEVKESKKLVIHIEKKKSKI